MKTGIDLVVGQSAVVDLTLPVGDLKQVITVEEAASPVNLSTQQTSGLVGERQVKELPLNGRSYDELMTLNPGDRELHLERSGGMGRRTLRWATCSPFPAAGPQENLFLLNGIEYTGASVINNTPGGTSGQLLGVDAVREFNVVTDTYGAEYGKRPGAQVSIVTASGTNRLHGTRLRISAQQRSGRAQFLRPGPIPRIPAQQFRRRAGRTYQEEQAVPVRQLRRLPAAPGPERRDAGSR